MSLGRFIRPVVTAHLEDTIVGAAKKLRDQHVGCLVVERNGKPYGILTDRDITLRVVAEGLDAATTTVADVATFDPIHVRDLEGVETVARRMREYGVRRVPVVDDAGALCGIITADDIVRLLGRELGDVAAGLAANVDSTDSR